MYIGKQVPIQQLDAFIFKVIQEE